MATVEERFWSKVDRANGPDACWTWTAKRNPGGYGRFWIDGGETAAHRVSHTLVIGPIPAGHVVHHECNVPACVNPAHLRAVTQRENVLVGASRAAVNARRTECHRGHPFDQVNTYINPSGERQCRECNRAKCRRQAAQKRVAA